MLLRLHVQGYQARQAPLLRLYYCDNYPFIPQSYFLFIYDLFIHFALPVSLPTTTARVVSRHAILDNID